jgi:hypothetical protein
MVRTIFWTLFVIIAAVAAYDVYLSIKLQASLYAMEENPLGRWLIELDNGDVALFMTAKMIGTTVVLLLLPALYRYRRRIGMATVGGLASMQASLFCYLTFA